MVPHGLRRLPAVQLILCFCCIGSGLALADVPQTIHYQGKLTETNNSPLVGQHTITLRLYDAPTGGTAVWEEQQTVALAKDDIGVFSVILGTHTPFAGKVSFNNPVWLGISIDGGEEFSPRQLLSSVGYAINADRLDGLDSTELLARTGGGAITSVVAGAGLVSGTTGADATLSVGAGSGIVVSDDAVSVDIGATAGKIVQLDAGGALPVVSGANLTALDASRLSAGTVPDARLSANVSLLGPSIESSELTDDAITAADTSSGFLTAGGGVTITKSPTSWSISASGSGGTITSIGDCTSGACFSSGSPHQSLTFTNTTSGTVTLQAVSGALGAQTISLPATTGTLVTTGDSGTVTGTMIADGANGVSLTTDVTGTLPIANGGTGLTAYAKGDLPYASAVDTLGVLAAGSVGQVLKVQAGGVPAWDADANGGGTVASITAEGGLTATPNPITGSGTLSLSPGGVTNTALSNDAVTTEKIQDGTIANADLSSSAAVDWTKISTATNKVDLGSQVASTLPIANGGTGAATAAAGRANLAAAASGANSDITSLSGLATPLSVVQGGTGAAALTDGGVLIGKGTSVITTTGVLAKGALIAGDGATDPTTLPVGANHAILVADALQPSGLKWATGCMPVGGVDDASRTATFQVATFGVGATNNRQDQRWPVPVAGTVSTLRAFTGAAPGGSGNSWIVTVRKNGANTTLSCTISGSSQSCSAAGAISFASGDRLGVEFVKSGSPAGTQASGWSACFIPS